MKNLNINSLGGVKICDIYLFLGWACCPHFIFQLHRFAPLEQFAYINDFGISLFVFSCIWLAQTKLPLDIIRCIHKQSEEHNFDLKPIGFM